MRAKTWILTLILAGCSFDEPPLEADEDESAEGEVSAAAPTHNPDFCPGGSGGPGGKPIPAPRDCTTEPTWEQCYACCDWNEKHSWGETCRRLKRREDRAACWRRLENEIRPACQKSCNRPGGPPLAAGTRHR